MFLGVHFALTNDEARQLKEISGDDERIDFVVNQVEKRCFRFEREWLCHTDKAWDPIHRTLTDGELTCCNGEYPLSHVILGGERLCLGDKYIMILKTPEQVVDIAAAMKRVSEVEYRFRFFQLDEQECDFRVDDDNLGYSWRWFGELRAFYGRAAEHFRSVLFTAPQ